MKRALLVIDVQNEYFTGKLPITYPAGSFTQILNVVDAANQNNIPVILIRHSAPTDAPAFAKGSLGWELHAELLARPYLRIIDKALPGSFTNTELESCLLELGADTLVISGYMTQMCCDTTARQAMHLGFTVEFLSDATGTLDIANYAGKVTAGELHNAVLVTQAMRFSKVLGAAEWINSICEQVYE